MAKRNNKFNAENIDISKLVNDMNSFSPADKEKLLYLADVICSSVTVPIVSNHYADDKAITAVLGMFCAGLQIGRQEAETELNKEKGQ